MRGTGSKGFCELAAGAGRALTPRVEGNRVRSGARLQGQLHHGVQHGELRPARHPHGRFNRGGPLADALELGVLQVALHRHQGGAAHRHRGRVQHPVRARPQLGRLLHHRGEPAPVPLVRPRLQGHGLPSRRRGRQARAGHAAARADQRGDQVDNGLLRALPRLRRHQGAALGPQQVRESLARNRLCHEVGGRGDGHRSHVGGVAAEGAAHGRPRLPRLRGAQGRLRRLRHLHGRGVGLRT
mmetsp:Transcript_38632/g.95712  ORF Transcript_38632/g.95712 Transcript_38632/m.95712 type:complete len:241 (-) Transcript_38632:2321-3043(-)